ncbi:MAG: glycosyltransferase family 9 protein [Nitrospinae bacterium]|nr:glycosyltransferase family 9 protein [Nitrospinota bacterium]MBF0633851.1 glycosyltransferase family 9 protein [Nitrospinota bacterium]
MAANILILNLTRMGDLIQTTPLIHGLREQNPDCRITMLANAKFAGILKFVEGVDELVTLDIHQFASKGGEEETDLLKVYEYLDGVGAELKTKKFDQIINLSHSKLSAALSLLLNIPDGRGFLSTPRGSRIIRNPWLVYFTSFLAFRRFNRFNLVDMYVRGADLTPGPSTRLALKPDEAAIVETRAKMEAMGVKDGDILVGFQAGASREDRRWNPRNFAKVGDALAESMNAKIVLFGSASEKKLGDEIELAMTAPVINLMGKTSLPELVAWVKRANLLVTNDTGTMHIGAAVGTPIVALFFVHARCEETGPYCDGAIILQSDISCAPCAHNAPCDHYSCLEYITADDVSAISRSVLRNEPLPLVDTPFFKRVKLYKSRLNPSGGADFVPMKKDPLDKYELFAYLYEPLFATALANWAAPERMKEGAELFEPAVERLKNLFAPQTPKDLGVWLNRAGEGAQKLLFIAEETIKLTVKIPTVKTSKALADIADRLGHLDVEIGTIADTHIAVSPLAYVYRRRLENFEGDDPASLARQAHTAAQWLERVSSLFMDGLKRARVGLL